jgi:carbohydrate-selective porin OprB
LATPGTEHVAELHYKIHALGGATFTPNLQSVRNAGGASARDATILGLKTVLKF